MSARTKAWMKQVFQTTREAATDPLAQRTRRRPMALPEVTEGNSQADWDLWQDSVAAWDSQFPSLNESESDKNKA